MGAFVISKRFNDVYKFAFTSKKGKTIFTSLGYELKLECEAAIEDLKANIENCTMQNTKHLTGNISLK